MTDRFIVKGYNGTGDSFDVVEGEPRLHYLEIDEVVGQNALFRTLRGTGKFKKDTLEVSSRNSLRHTPATAAGVKAVVRRLRDQEAERLDALNARIEDLKAQVVAAQRERVALVREAFNRGNVFTLKDALAIADRRLEERLEAKRRREAGEN